MDKITFFQQCVKEMLGDFATLSNRWSDVELIFDDTRRRYIVMRVGWHQAKRVHRCLVHIDIVDESILIQANNTEEEIKEDLIALGVPGEVIILGFLPPEVRMLLEQEKTERELEPA